MSRPKRLTVMIEGKDDLVLDEETTAMLYEQADEEGVSVEEFVKTHIRTMHLLMRHGMLKKL